MSKSTSHGTPRPDRPRLRFPKSARLRRSGEFKKVREQGRQAQGRFLRVGVLDEADGSKSVGIVTSRRVGGAVTRNKIRRRLREILRECLPQISAGLRVVVVAKPAAAEAEFPALRAEWLLLAGRLSIFARSE